MDRINNSLNNHKHIKNKKQFPNNHKYKKMKNYKTKIFK